MKNLNLLLIAVIMLALACNKSEVTEELKSTNNYEIELADTVQNDSVIVSDTVVNNPCEGQENYVFDLFMPGGTTGDGQSEALIEYEFEYNKKYYGTWFETTDSSTVSISRLSYKTTCTTQLSDLDFVVDSMCTKAYEKHPDAKIIYLDLAMWRDSSFHGTLKLRVP